MKTIHHGKLFLCFILVACVLATPTAYATGGGSFDVPQIHEDFNQGKPAPAPKPTEELNVAPSKQEKGFFSQVGDFVSGSWNKLKNGVSNTWNNLKNGAKKAWDTAASATKKAAQKAWDWMTSTAGKITGGIVLGITALTGLLSKFGQPLARGIQLAYTSLKNLFASIKGENLTASLGNAGMARGNSQYPYGKLSDLNVTDQQLAFAAQMAYEDEIPSIEVFDKLGEGWKEEKKYYIDHSSGLQAHVFKNSATQEIIIAFRGTEETFKDLLITDGGYIARGDDINNPQALEARKYLENIINDPDFQGYNIVLTGHSLGGYLAADCGARYKIPTVTFNAAGMNLYDNLNTSKLSEIISEKMKNSWFVPVSVKKALIWLEGDIKVGDQYKRNISDPQIREIAENEKAGAYDDLIRNYRYKDDLIGSFGYRPGKTYNIQSDGSIELAEDAKGLDNKKSLSWGHSISNFTGYDEGKKVDTPIVDLYGKDGNIVPRKKE
jgi:hypothetical protein